MLNLTMPGVWYKVTPVADGTLTVDTITPPSSGTALADTDILVVEANSQDVSLEVQGQYLIVSLAGTPDRDHRVQPSTPASGPHPRR